jgi:tetratricopeptide (TPR) repeat protein
VSSSSYTLCLAVSVLIFACTAFAIPPPADTLAEARRLIASSRVPEAREPLANLVAHEPGNLEARILLADVLGRIHRREEAIDLLKPALKDHSANAGLLGAYGGQCLLRAGELGGGFRALLLARRGRDAMERAVALAPGMISLREGLIEFYRQAPSLAGGDLEKARSHAAALAKLDPVRGAVWSASLLIEEKRYAEALAACDAALAVRPDDYMALFTLGRTVSESGLRLEDGEAALRRCLARTPKASEPGHAGVYYRLGMIAEKRGDRSAARAAYERCIAEGPTFNGPAEALKRVSTSP